MFSGCCNIRVGKTKQMKLFEKGWKKVGKDFERTGRVSFSLYFEKSFFGLGFGSERYSGCSNDCTEKYPVYSFKIYFGPFHFDGSICGKSSPLELNKE